MATVPQQREARAIDYPTGDGKPMAETDIHREDMTDLIETLKDFYAHKRKVYVSGNLLMCYKEDDPRKHVSPDVFVVQGVKKGRRDHYLVWREGKAPDVVFELTSKSTWREDKQTKWVIYRDILRVPEYFLFDPTRDYLKPPLQGFRLVAGDYVPIERVAGRLPSQVLSLHLERDGKELRLFDPVTGLRLQTPRERRESAERAAQAERQRAEQERRRAEQERRRAEQERRRAEQERQRAEAAEAAWQQSAQENERLRQELEALRRGLKSE